MKRYFLTGPASSDLRGIRNYFLPVPEQYAMPILRGLRAMLSEIAQHPERGAGHSEATRMLGEEVRTRVVPPYRIFYRDYNGKSEILAILHTAQDVSTILRERLQ